MPPKQNKKQLLAAKKRYEKLKNIVASNKKNKVEHPKNSKSDVTVSQLLAKCCNLYVTSPHMLTNIFLNYILNEIQDLCLMETSKANIKVINQILLDLSSVACNLNPPHQTTNQQQRCVQTTIQNNETVEKSCSDLKMAINESMRIDNLIFCLMEDKKRLYERLELSNVADKSSSQFTANNVNKNLTDSEEKPSKSKEGENKEINQYFDKNVISTAALVARRELDLLMKEEVNMVIHNPDKMALTRFFDVGATLMKTYKQKLICAASTGQVVQFTVKESILPFMPSKTKTFDIGDSPIFDISIWNNNLIICTINGCASKCSMRGDVVKTFPLNFPVAAVTELQGLLYVASQCGYLNILNLRSMMLVKDGIELGTTVTMMKTANYKDSTVLISLTEDKEIIGRSLEGGVIGSLKFKFTVPNMVIFDIVSLNDTPQLINFFCGTSDHVFCLQLENDVLSYGKTINHGTSAMLKSDNHIFLGSSDGDLTIINLKSTNTHYYEKLVNEKITHFACLMNSLFISTPSCIYHTNIVNE